MENELTFQGRKTLMKSNKLSNLFKSDMNFVGHAKYYFATIAALLISAIIIISVIGLKLGFDFKGGTIIEVVYGVEFDSEGNEYEGGAPYSKDLAMEKVENVLKTVGGFEISTVQEAKSEYGNKVVYKLLSDEEITNEQYDALKTALYSEFDKYDSNGIIQSKYIAAYGVPGSMVNVAVYGSIALSVAIVLLAIGVAIRYGISAMISVFLTSILNVLLTFAIVTICRTTVDVQFVGSVLTVFCLTLISNLIFLDKSKENLKNTELTRKDSMNLSVKQTLVTNALILSISIICSIFLTGFGVLSIRSFGIPVLVGTFFAFFSSIYVLPWLNFEIKIKNRIKRKSKNK